MISTPLEIEGDWEQITAEVARHKQNRLRLTVLPQPAATLPQDTCQIAEAPAVSADCLPLHEKIAAIMADVPEEEWAKLPSDLSDNLDHYVYGAPKMQ